ncbi:MAG: GH3 auxin-responsive promoter family protein [Prevotella sp.]|nr:GH3 auxin-responsive promoter family protein [Candidatus Prevotella equi]
MSITSIVQKVLSQRAKELERYFTEPETLQRGVLQRLLQHGAMTLYGREHDITGLTSYETFRRLVPVNSYEELKDGIDRMRHGEKDVLWPGQVKWYAKSSGTTNDKSKFVPVSKDGLNHIHYAGGRDTVVWYLQNNPQSRLFDGRALILGGSHAPNYNVAHSLVGDLSAILIENINPVVNFVRVPDKKTALISDFEVKREKIAQQCLKKNVTNLSGVPSWMMSVLTRVLELSGKDHLEDVWPNLEVFFHGGIAFAPYRKQYEAMITKPDMHYMETYNASEGFFGIQNDPLDSSMMLMVDYDIFYEFAPIEAIDDDGMLTDPDSVVPLWGVKANKNYAVIITTSCGLWRYMIGDTVKFTSTMPYKFHITGRTKSFINAFGEELIVDNAEKGLQYACAQTGAEVKEYTAAPVFRSEGVVPHHQWVIEFTKEPEDLDAFAQLLDNKLKELNSDYEAKRFKDINMVCLKIVKAREGLFHDWLKSKGKLGGQHKVPRLCNNRKIIEEILQSPTPTLP